MGSSDLRVCEQQTRSTVGFRLSIQGGCDWLGTTLYSRARSSIPFVLLLITIGVNATAQEKSSTTLLHAGISHSEILPALPPSQQVGQVFDGFDAMPIQSVQKHVVLQTQPLVQQCAKPTPVRNLPVSSPEAWQNKSKSAAWQAQRSATKMTLMKMPPGYANLQTPGRPCQSAIAAAIQACAGQRNPQDEVSRPQSLMLRAQPHAGFGTLVNKHSTSVLNGSGSSRQSASTRQRNCASIKPPTELRFKIPTWMAGVWQRSDSNELSRVLLPSGQQLKAAGHNVARVKDTFGTYRDQSGQIWQVFDPGKATGSIDRGDNIDYHTVTAYDLIVNGNDAPIVLVRATHVIVSKSTHKVLSSYQDEELNTFSKTPDGRLRTDSSVKVFDANGKPQLLTTALSMEVLLEPFSGPVRNTTK